MNSQVRELSYISQEVPGFGGTLKAQPDHFCVAEIPLYEPEGKGHHIYFNLTREGMGTREITEKLMRLFNVYETDVGTAGLKDKHSKATQTFSVYLANVDVKEALKKVKGELDVVVHSARRHRNKLRTGHLIGNTFKILLTEVDATALPQAEKIALILEKQGIPNFYGPQRFGNKGDNALRGRQILQGEFLGQRWLRNFMISSYTSDLFNRWLDERMRRGDWGTLYQGDVAKKVKTGGLFVVQDALEEQPRLDSHEITYTGPIYGWKMNFAQGKPGKWERELLKSEDVALEAFKNFQIEGSRRAGKMYLDFLSIQSHPEGLEFSFTLPKGAYATTVLREFMKNDLNF